MSKRSRRISEKGDSLEDFQNHFPAIFRELNEGENSVSKSKDEFARSIFVELFNETYKRNSNFFWLGVLDINCRWNKETNSNLQPSCVPADRGGIYPECGHTGVFYDYVKIDNEKIIELMMGCKK